MTWGCPRKVKISIIRKTPCQSTEILQVDQCFLGGLSVFSVLQGTYRFSFVSHFIQIEGYFLLLLSLQGTVKWTEIHAQHWYMHPETHTPTHRQADGGMVSRVFVSQDGDMVRFKMRYTCLLH